MAPRAPRDADQPQAAIDVATAPADHREAAWRWVRIAGIFVTVWVAYQLLLAAQSLIGNVLTVALFGIFGVILALVLAPPVTFLERRAHLPRTLAVLAVLLGALLTLVGLVYLIATPLAGEAKTLYQNEMPRMLKSLSNALAALQQELSNHGLNIGTGGLSQQAAADVSARVGGVLVTGVTGTVSVLVDVLIVIVIAFWVLRDGEDLRAGVIAIIPGRARSEVDFAFDAFSAVIGGYLRAQLLMAAIIGVLAGAGCALLGVPFPLVVGIAAGVFELIPIVGPFAGGAVALLLAATVSTVLVIFTGILFIAIHLVEAYVMAPRIQARFVRLHPLVALLALLAGIELGGFAGAFFAVPVASLLAVFLRAAVGDWRAQRPDLFSSHPQDQSLVRRRRRLLREFRFFGRSN